MDSLLSSSMCSARQSSLIPSSTDMMRSPCQSKDNNLAELKFEEPIIMVSDVDMELPQVSGGMRHQYLRTEVDCRLWIVV